MLVFAFVVLSGASDVLIQGEEDPAAVSAIVRSKQATLRACYERRLAERPELEGSVSVRFEIGASGAVASALVTRSTLNEPEVELCLLKTLRSLRFKKPKFGSVIVNYPFQFTPSGARNVAASMPSTRLSRGSVTAILARERPRFERCYVAAVAADPLLRGERVTLQFAIGDLGEAIDVAVDASAVLPSTLQACMIAALSALRFPAPVAGEKAKISLPFILWSAVSAR